MSRYATAARAHDISVALDIPFGAAWRVANCVMKFRYDSEEDALEYARRWESTCPQRPYECDVCGRWHLSTKGDRGDSDDKR